MQMSFQTHFPELRVDTNFINNNRWKKQLSSAQNWWQFSSCNTKLPPSQQNCQLPPPVVISKVPNLGEETTSGLSKLQPSNDGMLAAAENNPVILKHIIKTRSHYQSNGCTMTHVKPAYGPSSVPKHQVSRVLQLLSGLRTSGQEPEPCNPMQSLHRLGSGSSSSMCWH